MSTMGIAFFADNKEIDGMAWAVVEFIIYCYRPSYNVKTRAACVI